MILTIQQLVIMWYILCKGSLFMSPVSQYFILKQTVILASKWKIIPMEKTQHLQNIVKCVVDSWQPSYHSAITI